MSPPEALFRKLLEIVARLRAPDGCPWDRQQTPESLRKYLVEEAYEAYEAIGEGAVEEAREELGDLLFLILMVAHIYQERGDFTLEEMLELCAEKMIRRHPHVFGEERAASAEEVLARWQRIKESEKSGKSSVLGNLPRSLPALQLAFRLGERASRVGFDWSSPEEVLPKLREEWREIEENLAGASRERLEEEIGDFLFTVANLSRKLGINPEEALKKSLAKFRRRFEAMEEYFRGQGRDLREVSLEEMDQVWERVKTRENAGNRS
ncbi:nucleoside triphosphate pyrophosphohydrolase [Thermosulfurimonas sp. F29]|uniref:nucleoside triphosphate pyrophosphohydrolase n=1 Tax=Thermosulfurimonas sp. F29 TaxID=2867247 RepID=UPI001C8334CB|nr:nucleoside triphosphate pyrophosphohydrolase [Thermosulfurimonas sp. F29]MBX6423073.1 nucleoside triphosphate pyrophosphohydrolase [Thermosulfurimonas sp. F29]